MTLDILEITLWGLSIFCSTAAIFLAVLSPNDDAAEDRVAEAETATPGRTAQDEERLTDAA
jgi:hypothetical protein